MPELDGIETSKLLNDKIGSNMQSVIMVSSFRQESIIKLAKDAGIDIFLQKPINPSHLNDILSSVFLKNLDMKTIAKKQEKSPEEELQTLHGSNILLVEDNATNQQIIIGLLENSGINIDIADNGQIGVDMYNKNPEKYELILMDLQMPIMGGIEATKIIRENDKDIVIIALTANAMREDVQKTQEAGMNEHLNKPIDVEDFFKKLIKYISKKRNIIDICPNASMQEKEIAIPQFINIDTQVGLSHLAENKTLYIKLLHQFYNKTKDLKLEDLNDEDLKREAHTIKGLSANLGALELSSVAKELELTLDKELFNIFYIQLDKVLDELKDIKYTEDDENISSDVEISDDEKNRLFLELKEAVLTKQAKKCKPVITKLEKYNLKGNDKALFENIKIFVKKFKFKDAIELTKGIE